MSLRIYEMEHSPFCIPVTRALDALGQDFERVPVSNWDRRPVIEVTGGKYYQVPVLVHGEKVIGESSPESQDIARYVDATFAGGRLFPESNAGLQEIVIEHVENEIEGRAFKLVDPLYLDSFEDSGARMMVIRHKERKFGPGCVEAWGKNRDGLAAELAALLERFDRTLKHHPFLFGEAPVYADFSLFGALGNLQYRDYNQLPEGLVDLKAWYDRLSSFRF